MKKGILKALTITALVAVSAVGGLALGAEISNGFETTYSESAYEDYGDKQHQAGFDAGKEEGLQEGFENGQQAGHEAGFEEGQQAGYENGYTDGEEAGYDSGFEAGQTYRDPEKTYLEDIIGGVELNVYKMDSGLTFLSDNGYTLDGIFALNADNSVEQIYNEGKRWDIFYELSNGSIIITSRNYSSGILFYNINSNKITKIYETGIYWTVLTELSNGNVLIKGRASSEDCILIFDPTTFQIDVFYNETMGEGFELSNGNILMNDGEKFILYNVSTNEFKQIYTDSGYWSIYYEMSNGDVIICGNGINGQSGLLLYDASTNEIMRIYNEETNWNYFYELSNGNVIITMEDTGTGGAYGILLYNFNTKEVTTITSSGVYWTCIYEITNGNVLFSSTFNSGLYIYDMESKEFKSIYDLGNNWDTFVEDENGVTISSSVNTSQGKVYYDFETGTVTPIEEVA